TPDSRNWYFFRFDMTDTIQGKNYGGDYPGLGVDSRALYITYNMAALPLMRFEGDPGSFNFSFLHSKILVFDKAKLNQGELDARTHSPVGGFVLQPVSPVAGSDPGNVAYFLELP